MVGPSWGELKHGRRLIRKQPMVAATVVLALAVGIGMATTGFTFMNSVLRGELPFDNGDRFVRLTAMLAAPELLTTLTVVATSFYAPVYLFIAMRRVYGQGRFVTFLKYIALTFAYIIGFTTIIGLTFALAAFSV